MVNGGKGLDVNSLVQGLISIVVGAVLATVTAIGLVSSQTAAPEPTAPADLITYDS
jgi:hypothetical protein